MGVLPLRARIGLRRAACASREELPLQWKSKRSCSYSYSAARYRHSRIGNRRIGNRRIGNLASRRLQSAEAPVAAATGSFRTKGRGGLEAWGLGGSFHSSARINADSRNRRAAGFSRRRRQRAGDVSPRRQHGRQPLGASAPRQELWHTAGHAKPPVGATCPPPALPLAPGRPAKQNRACRRVPASGKQAAFFGFAV